MILHTCLGPYFGAGNLSSFLELQNMDTAPSYCLS